MKKRAAVLGVVALAAMLAIAAPKGAKAGQYNDQYDTHPLELVGYLGNAVGQLANWVVFRPVHWLVSQPHADIVFGHKPHLMDEKYDFAWLHGDYSPSIAEAKKAKEQKATAPAAKK